MADDSPSTPDANTGRFAVLTNPVRGFAERAVARAWPGRRTKTPPVSVPAEPEVAASGYETPAPSFVTSEVISAFHLQQLHLPSGVDRVTRGAATGGKVAIVASVFALVSLIGLGWWASSVKTSSDVTLVASTSAMRVPQANTAELALKPNLQVSAVPAGATPASETERAPENATIATPSPVARERPAASLNGPKQHRAKHAASRATTGLSSDHPLRQTTQTEASLSFRSAGLAASAEAAEKDAISESTASTRPGRVDEASAVTKAPAVVSARPLLEVPRIRRQPNTDE